MRNLAVKIILPLALLAAAAIIWQIAVEVAQTPSYILPTPWAILITVYERAGLLLSHTFITLIEICLGFATALVLGLFIATLIHSSKIIEHALLPLVIASQTIPVFAIAPLLILWFGYGIGSKVVMTAIIVFFPIVINTVQGLRAADPDTLALFQILEASPRQVFMKVKVPQALPFIFSGIKIGMAVSVIGAVIGEWVGSSKGLGYLMIHANAQLQVDLVFASILFLSIIGTGLYAMAALAERVFIPWQKQENK